MTHALASIRSEPPGLIFAEASFAGELLEALRSVPATRSVPVILLTVDPTEGFRVWAFESGADDCMVKPFQGRDLLLRVRSKMILSDRRGK